MLPAVTLISVKIVFLLFPCFLNLMFKSDVVFVVMSTILRPYLSFVVSFILHLVVKIQLVHLPAYCHGMYRNMMGLVTSVLLTVITIISQRGNDLLY